MNREIQHFLAIASEGSLTGAASLLGITQSALSKSLRRLEAHLGMKLVERGVRGTRLTNEGHKIHARALSVEAEMRCLDLEAKELRSSMSKRLRIGASPSWGTSAIPDLVHRFCQAYSDVEINIATGLEAPLIEKLKTGELDIVLCSEIATQVPAEVSFHPICEIDVIAACRKSHPLVNNWTGQKKELFAQNWLDYRSALHRPRPGQPPLSTLITGNVLRTESWFLVPLLLAKMDLLVVLPEQMGEYLAVHGLTYLAQDYKVNTIRSGIWLRNSVSETAIGKSFVAMARETMLRCAPSKKTERALF